MATPPREPGHVQHRMSADEMRVLRECNSESFYRRSVPISSAMMAGTLYMIRSGRWQPGRRFGVVPKVAVAGIVGYFIGKISYMETCKEKLMRLPNSEIGRLLRKQRSGGVAELGLPEQGEPAAEAAAGASSVRPEWSLPPRSEGLDDYYRPTVDTPGAVGPLTTDDIPPAQNYTTYEELRRQNRAELEQRLRRGAPADQPPPERQERRPPPSPPDSSANKYGDVWDK
ncbi:OCIA domain-containing protein 1-like [Amphibalanus amphitrite]|uniref:OCIA domain-containing protein 1-like n=1 Tax=Amphibalanus amphitrite TaxID=1232801 RepID=UPI001C90DB13|nr:OCIA domain-containing protein 1-like [Amphibalanus amphitrite]XP_043214623.1 OCIA domain-containing protein 1-like [Amphibalanus amphitrite]XP_043237324.1 OCIA domain-containing protein 1-like [Amphibalanus amphitrite]XP_043237325.1 OCIA domain-containing protein 1-like [Amphibalanus amphitrite]XP_043237326.1 OCIA domain-containing protein 1-like [Amphibalanus amphitrite]XP_043237327.1 OCIA domain-containing protein 1-like [Amphibalanus amphitrite]XP_043237328.1 OCIA domain-containing pro